MAGPKRNSRWLLAPIGFSAFVATWGGWVGLAEKTGYGRVNLLPGVVDPGSEGTWQGSWSTVNLGVALPLGVEAYAAYAMSVWFGTGYSKRAKGFASVSAIFSLLLAMAGQVSYHVLESTGKDRAPTELTGFVSCLPVLVIGMAAALHHLTGDDATDELSRQSDATDELSRQSDATDELSRQGDELSRHDTRQGDELSRHDTRQGDELSRHRVVVPDTIPSWVDGLSDATRDKATRQDDATRDRTTRQDDATDELSRRRRDKLSCRDTRQGDKSWSRQAVALLSTGKTPASVATDVFGQGATDAERRRVQRLRVAMTTMSPETFRLKYGVALPADGRDSDATDDSLSRQNDATGRHDKDGEGEDGSA